ncbi:MAG: hypothetical protein ABSA52_15260 [Candidatus Binatia bacterium]|jgi:CRISPR/Cas system-associated protein Csx1
MTISFIARDAEGREYTIIVTTESIETATKSGRSYIPGRRLLETTNGDPVNRIAKGVYEVLPALGPAVRVASDHPDAP